MSREARGAQLLDVAEELCVGDLALALEVNEDAVGYALRVLRTDDSTEDAPSVGRRRAAGLGDTLANLRLELDALGEGRRSLRDLRRDAVVEYN